MSAATSLALALVLSIPFTGSPDVCGVVRRGLVGYSIGVDGEICKADEVAAKIALVDLVSALVAPMRRPMVESFKVNSDPLAGGFERVTVECLLTDPKATRDEHRAVAYRVSRELGAAGLLACVDGFKVVVMVDSTVL